MECGKKIAHLRKTKDMTQEELGKVLSVTYQAVSKWERGESLPDFEMMTRIAKFFNVPLNYFTDDGEEPSAEVATDAVAEVPAPAVTASVAGICTSCGKMVAEDDIAQREPKILCKSCSERLKKEAEERKAEADRKARIAKEKEIFEQRGHGVKPSLFISLIVAIACYIGLSVFSANSDSDTAIGAAALLFFIPLALFGAVQAFASFLKELKDDLSDNFSLDDGPEGYTRNISLFTAGVVAVINLACFLALYLTTKEDAFLIFLVVSVILSFTFVSQFMWGGVVKTVFTAGGFTFKLPGFIFSLNVESILLMLITKFFLGLLSVLLFLVTTVAITVVAILVSAVTFIPSVRTKSVKDKKVEKDYIKILAFPLREGFFYYINAETADPYAVFRFLIRLINKKLREN